MIRPVKARWNSSMFESSSLVMTIRMTAPNNGPSSEPRPPTRQITIISRLSEPRNTESVVM
ncbi:hypothetical protein D3C72_2553890 [compost metagenome]